VAERNEIALRELTLTRRVTIGVWGSLSAALRVSKRRPLGAFGGVLVLAAVVIAVFAPALAPYDPETLHTGHHLEAPNATFLMGTNGFSQDILSRIIFGARISLFVGLLASSLGSILGLLLGVFSAYVGKAFDLLMQRLVDAMLAFPMIILALMLMSIMGRSLTAVIISLVFINVPLVTRIIRSTALSVKEEMYVEAARAIGAPWYRIIMRHVAPNCFAPLIVLATASLGWSIVIESTLSFIGLGVPPNIPTWGGMLGTASQHYFSGAWWVGIFPGVALTLVVFGINLFGDMLRDVLDPRLRGSR